MKKRLYAILGIAAAVFVIIAVAVPFAKGGVFIISLISALIAFALQIPFFKVAFEDRESLKSKVLGFPVFRVGMIYLCAQVTVSLLFMILATVIPAFPMWIAVVICVIILGAALICGISADVVRDSAENVERSQAVDTRFMTELRTRAQSLVTLAEDDNIRRELTKLAEDIRYSDPVSNDKTADSETALDSAFADLEKALTNGDGDVLQLCKNARNRINERNNIAKMTK